MMTPFFLCFKDQSALGEGHEMYYWKVEVSRCQGNQVLHLNLFRGSYGRCSTGVRKLKRCSKFLTKFTIKTPVRTSFLKFIKKETLAQLFSCEFCEISEDIFFTEHLLIFLLFFYWSLSLLPSFHLLCSWLL